ncbi:MAG: glycosyltransferase [Bacteroidia bacterium]|nr:glycosyltransferase [Bacteroidia bacterium]
MRIVLPVTNDLSGDQRLRRTASALRAAGQEVIAVGRQLPESLPLPGTGWQQIRMRLRFRRGKLFYLEYNLRLWLLLLRLRPAAIHANDLDTLAACWLAARLTGARLVYDSHEYFTEVPELLHRPLTRGIWLALERLLLPRTDAAITVSAGIAQAYAQRYGRPFAVVRNVPFRRERPAAAREPGLLLYQGALNTGRGVGLMIRALEHLPEYRLWIIGRGDVEAELRALAAASAARERVIFKGFVPAEQLPGLTAQASLGFSLEEELGASYRLALPNKLFDYLQARVPVLVSDLPEMRSLVETYGTGAVLPAAERTPEGLAAQIRALLEDPERYARCAAACEAAAAELCWEEEQARLLAVYAPWIGTAG